MPGRRPGRLAGGCWRWSRRREAGALLGKGYLAFTCDQGPDMDRYQGIVAIEGATLTEMTAHYFRTSEQLRTFVRLACAETEAGWRASALIMETGRRRGRHRPRHRRRGAGGGLAHRARPGRHPDGGGDAG